MKPTRQSALKLALLQNSSLISFVRLSGGCEKPSNLSTHNLAGDAVQVLLAVAGDLTATLVDALGALLHDLHLLQLLQNVTDETARGLLEVLTVDTLAGRTTVHLLERAHTSVLAQVHLTRDRGGTDVVPVRVGGRVLLERGRLDHVPPSGQLDLA
ncbi:hypothetical protein PPTG_23778 [Phytophthora nicotianae INRA-310]|uniref:Uncharacterized protein n=1 Tax=Phytophthora nicotianae (strain INRA-310) TaxID=761204 RepID=W2PR34_PHYN3|nr:hypothetical protein PPTG_23778 [Phytophthora nicotianae INRA-310]ETN03433.1 hypothetical protein PPTG_23778 [Phytophthora nicotianae INRA-310]